MPVPVVVALEPVEIHHQHGHRPVARRTEVPVELALERAVVPEPRQRVVLGLDLDLVVRLRVAERDRRLGGEELRELELVLAVVGLVAAHPADVEGAQHLALRHERDDDHRLRLERRARDLDRAIVEMGIVGEHRLAMVDRPARQPSAERSLVAEDQLREAIAGDDRAANASLLVDPIDRERVVRDHGLQGVRDHLEDARRVEGRQEPLVDRHQPALADELVLELHLLRAELLQALGVDERLRGGTGEDAEGGLVVRPEPVPTQARRDHDAPDAALVHHRHREHGLRAEVLAEDQAARVGMGIADEHRLTVLGDPAGDAVTDANPEQLRLRVHTPHERALERDRLAPAGVVVHAVDAEGVVRDERARLRDDRLADAPHVLDRGQPGRQVLDGTQPRCEILHRGHELRVADGRRDRVAEAPGQRRLVVGPVVRACVVQDEECERLAAEYRGHEAQRLDRELRVQLTHLLA